MDGGVDLNLGDEALSDCLAAGILARRPGAGVRRLVSVRGSGVRLGEDERSLRDLGGLLREIGQADVVVLGGGTLLQDDPGLLRWQTLISLISRGLGKPVVIAAVGAEGLRGPAMRVAAASICRMASEITVRDQASGEVVRRVSGRQAEVVADPVLLTHSLLPHPVVRETLAGTGIAVNLTREAPRGFIATLAGRLAQERIEGEGVLGVAMDRRPERDTAALMALGEALGWPEWYRLLHPEATWREVCAVLGASRLCLGMRLHFMLLASIAQARVVAVTTLPKTVAFAREFEVEGIGTEASDAELGRVMSHAHAPEAQALAALGERAARTVDRILAAR
jgi:polysaccharide pyruvyl transferase WcaK-like protein